MKLHMPQYSVPSGRFLSLSFVRFSPVSVFPNAGSHPSSKATWEQQQMFYAVYQKQASSK